MGESERSATGRKLPDPGFGSDTGATDPDLAAALQRFAVDRRRAPVLVALSRTRVLVPVVAVLGETEHDEAGPLPDKTADIAAVLMQGRDGRNALLVFTGLAGLTAWRDDARPVPVPVGEAARAALQEGAGALLLDVAGPTAFVVETAEVHELARGHVLVATRMGYAWLSAPESRARM